MVNRVSTTAYHAGLAALAAVAFAFPTPKQAMDAVSRAILPTEPNINTLYGDARIELSPSIPASVIQNDRAERCLVSTGAPATSRIQSCTHELHDALLAYPGTSPLPVVAERFTDPVIEEKRLALAEMCRALWVTNEGRLTGDDLTACAYVSGGIEQTASMQ